VIAGCFALSAFAVAVLAGLSSDNPAGQVLGRAVACMVVCYPVGLIAGIVCVRVIGSHVEAHRLANPIPGEAKVAHGRDEAASDEEVIVV
jgi:hypothetical protein